MSEPSIDKKTGLFDFLNDLTYNKQYLFDDVTEKEFNVYMVNKGMSQNSDLILIANEMNKASGLSKQMVHDFYFHIVKGRKRYAKWAKADNDNKDDIELLMKHYCVNRTVAEGYLKNLNRDQIDIIKSKYVVGGSNRK